MCCFFTVLVFLGPRLAGLVWWILQPVRWVGTTAVSAFNGFLLPIVGLILLPWLTLMYVIVAPGGIVGLDWLWLGLALLADIAAYGGGGYGNRNRLGNS